MDGWIGVDLDGTLAYYDKWEGPTAIGEPIQEMIRRVKEWLRSGQNVRIFTARVYAPAHDWKRQKEAAYALLAIQAWCLLHLGTILPVTCQKDFDMIELWDDRAVSVATNTGIMT